MATDVPQPASEPLSHASPQSACRGASPARVQKNGGDIACAREKVGPRRFAAACLLSLVAGLGLACSSGKPAATPAKAAPEERGASQGWTAEEDGRALLRASQPLGAKSLASFKGALTQGVDFLETYKNPAGKFLYRQYVDGRDVADETKKYNARRHAEALYALGAVQASGLGTSTLTASIANTADYLLLRHIRRPKGSQLLRVSFSWPEEEKSDSGIREAHLGAASMALLGLAEAKRIDANSVDIEILQSLGRFILFMHKDEGGFHSKYSEVRHFDVDFESQSYPSQAAWALARLQQLDPQKRWRQGAAEALSHIAWSRRGVPAEDLPQEPWFFYAARELLPDFAAVGGDKLRKGVDEASIYQLLRKTALAMLVRQAEFIDSPAQAVRGSFDDGGGCLTAAKRVEAMVVMHDIAKSRGDDEILKPLETGMMAGANFLLGCQVAKGPLKGGIVRSAQRVAGSTKKIKRHNRRQAEIRIDQQAHALVAWTGVLRVCEASASACGTRPQD